MDLEELKKIVNEYESRPNRDLIKVMDHINEEFEKTKNIQDVKELFKQNKKLKILKNILFSKKS